MGQVQDEVEAGKEKSETYEFTNREMWFLICFAMVVGAIVGYAVGFMHGDRKARTEIRNMSEALPDTTSVSGTIDEMTKNVEHMNRTMDSIESKLDQIERERFLETPGHR